MAELDAAGVERIRAAVHAQRDPAVALLQALVRTPSITGDEGAAQALVADAFRQRGLDVDVWDATPEEIAPYIEHVGAQARYAGRPNVVGVRRGSGGGRSLHLNAHIDTVENGDPATWTTDPNGGAIVGDLLFGRGSCDMHGGLVTHLLALDALAAAGMPLRGDVSVSSTVGEEDGGVGALSTILRGYRADGVLITEPTKLALVIAQGGSLVFRLTVPGKSAHAAVRDEGVSALEAFVPLFQELQAFERIRNVTLSHPLYDHMANKIPINVGVVRAGVWASTVPESLVAEVRVGLLPGETLGAFKAQVLALIAATAARDPWLRAHPPIIDWFGGQFAPAETAQDAPLTQAVSRAHRLVTGATPSIEGVPYGADMRLFTEIGGMPCVMYGAGDVTLAHHADEHIAIPDLLTAATTVACLLAEWCG